MDIDMTTNKNKNKTDVTREAALAQVVKAKRGLLKALKAALMGGALSTAT